MDSDKSIVLRVFNKLFFELIDDILSVYPDNVDILTAKDAFLSFKKLNPTCIIKVWHSCIYSKYKQQIDVGDIEFFMHKDYSNDLTDVSNMKNILDMIDNVREPVRTMSEQNKQHVKKYIQDLSKLSTTYSTI
jgi:hypothetical protein